MAFNLVQAGSSLYAVNTDGALSPALTLPTGVVLADDKIPRFARFKNYVVVVNTPSRPLSVGTDGTVRVLTPFPPTAPVALTGATGGTLSGLFSVKETFVILDANLNVISESDFGPTSTGAQITTQWLRVTGINISPDTISTQRLYRTTSNGAVYFQWIDTGGNTATSLQDDQSDAAIGLLAAPVRGTAPDLVLCTEWNGRLFGVGRGDGDNLRWTEAGTMYAWGALNTLPIPRVGDDRFGITALVPRRNVLGVGRHNRLIQVAGATNADLRPIGTVENCGILSQESVATYRDVVFFLWLDGVYQWDNDGVKCISDLAGVSSWFQTDSYFTRGMFSQAFATFDTVNLLYRLYLCSAGGTTPDRWVEYSLKTGKFYGPHTTDVCTPSSALWLRGTNDQMFPMMGSREGYISQDVDERSDWSILPIHMRVTMRPHDADDPDTNKYFGQLSVHTEVERGGILTITPQVGDKDDLVTGDVMSHDLRISRERLDRIGAGKLAVLTFENQQIGQKVTIHGYEIDPVHPIGKR